MAQNLSPKRSKAGQFVALVFLLTRRDRTCDELVLLTGACTRTVRYYLKSLSEEGLVEKVRDEQGKLVTKRLRTRGRGLILWRWVAYRVAD